MIPFTKYSGSGNDFVVIDNRCGTLASLQDEVSVRRICNRHEGVGADGVIFLEKGPRMRIFQPDGKEVEMCGNGLRCLGHFFHQLDPSQKNFEVATMHATTRLSVDAEGVTIEMPVPHDLRLNRSLKIDHKEIEFHTVNTGVPHLVIFNDGDMDLARMLRYHAEFAPAGTNVNFVRIAGPSVLEIRTYERGVEGETQACGTGATAAALIAAAVYNHASPIMVVPVSGEPLTISFPHPVTLRGPARATFTGHLFRK